MAETVENLEQEEQEQQEAKPIQEKQEKEEKTYSHADWQADQEKLARSNGWKPFEEFMEAGGDPTKWRDAGAFNIFGEMIGTIRKKEEEFNSRIEGVQKLAQAQLNQERARLIAERDALIEEGGRSKDVKALDNQLDKLNNATQTVQTQAVDPILQRWNDENPWINERSPKSTYAKTVFAEELSSGKSVAQAVQAVDRELAKHYPPQTQQQRRHIPESERGRNPGGFKAKPQAVTMDTLSDQERAIWRNSSSMWGGDEKAFLQSVNDSRKAEGGR